MSNHSILHPGVLHYAYAVLRHGVYGHAAHCIRVAAVFHTVGSHTPEISSSGYLTGHDPTNPDPRIPGSRIYASTYPTSCIPGYCTARMLYYAMGVYLHAATLHPWVAVVYTSP